MLKNSFCHIPGIGPARERRLWADGLDDWDTVLARDSGELWPRSHSLLHRHVLDSYSELGEDNATYFARRLPSDQQWRLFPEFRHSTAYFDIETAGPAGDITTIAVYDGFGVRCYVRGRNLDAFPDDIREYKVLVSYNGKCFDQPVIEQYFGIALESAHIDLRYVLASLGFKGGLKGCEKQFGIDRGPLDGLDGYFAILLWRDYRHNRNERALETLLAYNVADVVNLETLMVEAYNLKVARTPFAADLRFAAPVAPVTPYRPDPLTIDRIRHAVW